MSCVFYVHSGICAFHEYQAVCAIEIFLEEMVSVMKGRRHAPGKLYRDVHIQMHVVFSTFSLPKIQVFWLKTLVNIFLYFV